MKLPAIAFIIALVALAIASILASPAPQPPAQPVCPTATCPVAEPPRAGDALLRLVHHCVDELYANKTGAGGNALRFDALSMRPYSGHFGKGGGIYELPMVATSQRWQVRIEEEHPHRTVPSGIEFAIDVDSGRCSHVPRD